MQASLLSANTYNFIPMMSRVGTVEEIKSYRDPRPDWTALDTAEDVAKKVPTESDDRDDYSSDSERAEDDVDGSGRRDSGGVQSEDGVFESPAAIVRAKQLLVSTPSLGEPAVVVDTEPASAFPYRGDVYDGKTETADDGIEEIVDRVEKVDLKGSELMERGPHGGQATKFANGDQRRGQQDQRREPNESSDGECLGDQPMKFIKTSRETVHCTGDFYADHRNGTRPPQMKNQGGQHHWCDPHTGQSFPVQFLQQTDYFGTPHQEAAPTNQFHVPPAIWTPGYPSRNNGYIPDKPQFCPTVEHQPLQFPSNGYTFCPQNFSFNSTTFNQHLNTVVNNENHQTAIAAYPPNNHLPPAASYVPIYQHSLHDPALPISVRTVPPVLGSLDPNLMHDMFHGDILNIAVPEADPITKPTSTYSELDLAFEWVNDQPETNLPSTSVVLPPVIMPSCSGYPLHSIPSQPIAPCSELTPISNPPPDSSYFFTYPDTASYCSQLPSVSSGSSTSRLSNGYHGVSPTRGPSSSVSPQNVHLSTAASSPSCPFTLSVSSSLADLSPLLTALNHQHPADDRLTHSSPGSDWGTTAAPSVISVSDHGSVADSPSSLSEDGATIVGGDDTDVERTSQIAEAQAIADSYQDMALITPDSQGDTPLHVAMIDDHWYLAESLLRRLIRDDLLKDVVNIRNKLHQQTPLCLAVIFNKPRIVETLIEHGADVNVHIKASDDYLGTKFSQPLHFASIRGHLWKQTLKKILWAKTIDLDAFNSDGKSALHCAIEGHGRLVNGVRVDCKDTLRMLAERGANLNQPDCGHEKTPLHYAIERRDVELVSRLLVLAFKFTPDRDRSSVANMLEAKTGNGNTALHLAASVDMDTVEHKKLIQQLMSKGADPSSKNSDGFLPRELTKNRAIVELLKGRTSSGRSPTTDKKRNS